jgi:hypothetical protein
MHNVWGLNYAMCYENFDCIKRRRRRFLNCQTGNADGARQFQNRHKAEQNVGAKVGAAPRGASIGYDSTIGDSEAHLEPEPFVGALIVRRPLQQCTYFARSTPGSTTDIWQYHRHGQKRTDSILWLSQKSKPCRS